MVGPILKKNGQKFWKNIFLKNFIKKWEFFFENFFGVKIFQKFYFLIVDILLFWLFSFCLRRLYCLWRLLNLLGLFCQLGITHAAKCSPEWDFPRVSSNIYFLLSYGTSHFLRKNFNQIFDLFQICHKSLKSFLMIF